MSRISIDVSLREHQKLKALAALQGLSIKDFVLERTLGASGDRDLDAAQAQLEALLDERIRRAEGGTVRVHTVQNIFKSAPRAPRRK